MNFCVVRAFQCSISSEICDGCSVLFIYITIGWKYSHRVELMCCGVVVIVEMELIVLLVLVLLCVFAEFTIEC